MNERDELLASVADIIKDYRAGEIPQPTPDHVGRWIHQFDGHVQVSLLRELGHVLKRTYFSRSYVRKFLAALMRHPALAGEAPCDFWQAAHLLDIQQHGHSQSDIRELFGEALKEECGLVLDKCGSAGGTFIYLDDVLFTGGRIGTDLSAWIADRAPGKGSLQLLVIATHKLGEWQCTTRLGKVATDTGKDLEMHCWASVRFENRKKYRDASEVLWPAVVPDDAATKAYVAGEPRFPFEPRQAGGRPEKLLFTSEQGRQLLEREMLLAGSGSGRSARTRVV